MRHPPWLRVPYREDEAFHFVERALEDLGLNTVCEAAACPNRAECHSQQTATFMILGDTCTRNCRFCAVPTGRPDPPDETEPERVARAAERLGLSYVVITSVTRDDLDDGGASHFAATIQAVRRAVPGARVEVLVPDFGGDAAALDRVLQARPDVLNHNVETVQRLYPAVRPGAVFSRSLELLGRASQRVAAKSGLMLGLGETPSEVTGVLSALLGAGCKMVTLGQYLSPGPEHLQVERFIRPEEFEDLGEQALRLGFDAVAAGPLVRSSRRAAEMAADCL
jgi:lipoic acid synthetase